MQKTILALAALLTLSLPACAQATSATVPANVNVSTSLLQFTSFAQQFRFGTVTSVAAPVTPGVETPIFSFEDQRFGYQSGYHVTVQTTDFTGPSGTIDSQANWLLNGAPVATVDGLTVHANANTPPTAPSFTSTEFKTTARTLITQAPSGATDGQGAFDVTLDQTAWPLTIPVTTPNGTYTATVTFSIIPNP